MTTHSSALAWRSPWTAQPGIGYIVSQRVKSTEATSAHTRGNPESLARLQVLRGAALSTGLWRTGCKVDAWRAGAFPSWAEDNTHVMSWRQSLKVCFCCIFFFFFGSSDLVDFSNTHSPMNSKEKQGSTYLFINSSLWFKLNHHKIIR